MRCWLVLGFWLGAACSIATAADLTNGLAFVAITPCRIIDTRNGQGFSGGFGSPALTAGVARTFQITGTTIGTPTQCGIPETAEAISANFTATQFAGAGDLRAFPAGGTVPNASILNYRLETLANTVTVPLGPSGGGHNGIAVQADVSDTQLVVDISGYYVAKVLTLFVGSDGTFVRGVHAVLASHLTSGVYAVKFDRDVSTCVWIATVQKDTMPGPLVVGFAIPSASTGDNTALLVQTFSTGGTAFNFPFALTVTCP